MRRVWVLALLAGCTTAAGQSPPPPAVERVRFEEDHVTCYVARDPRGVGLSCLQDVEYEIVEEEG